MFFINNMVGVISNDSPSNYKYALIKLIEPRSHKPFPDTPIFLYPFLKFLTVRPKYI